MPETRERTYNYHHPLPEEEGRQMSFSVADARAILIDPAIHKCGWTEVLIRLEEAAGTVEIISGKARRRVRGKIDYVEVKGKPGVLDTRWCYTGSDPRKAQN